ncbi:MAG: polyhydroxyalkanoate depolymerase [Candidatus Velthaea sp.]
MTPARWSAATTKSIFGNPFNPLAYTAAGRMMAASADVFNGLSERRGKPAWNIAATIETIDERPFGSLVRFTRRRTQPVPRVLLVAPMSGHYATLLRGTIDALVGSHDVYVTDWADARDIPLAAGRFDLDDYIAYVIDYLRMLGPDVHAIAVCQPAPAVLAAVALMAAENDPAQPRSMVLMGGPVDTRVAPTAPTRLSESKPLSWFEDELTVTVPPYYRGAGRKVYPGFVQLGAFLSMNPRRHAEAHIKMYNELVAGDGDTARARRAFYDEYFSVMDVSAEYYLQTVDMIFQQHALPRGIMTWRGRPVDTTLIEKTALMTVEGELDDISAPGQTLAAHAMCPAIPDAKREQYMQPGVGHYGIFNGRHWRDEIAPRIGPRGAPSSARRTRSP